MGRPASVQSSTERRVTRDGARCPGSPSDQITRAAPTRSVLPSPRAPRLGATPEPAPLAAFSIDLDAALPWRVSAMGVVVGLMSSVIRYSLVLTCLSPVIAALGGWVVLRQQLSWTDYLAIVLVTGASIGAVRSAAPAYGGAIA